MSHFTGVWQISNRRGRFSSPNVFAFRTLAQFLTMIGLLLMGSSLAAQDDIGAGMGFDVEYISPQRASQIISPARPFAAVRFRGTAPASPGTL